MKLEGIGLRKRFGKREVLKGVSLSIEKGKIFGLLGPNGAGKTTTMKILVGIEKPTEGKVFLDGKDVTHLPLWRRVKEGIAFLPQESSLFDEFSVKDNVLFACEIVGKSFSKALELLKFFRVEDVLNQKADEISGGERRKVELARVLLLDPQFLMLDEPFAGIDPKSIGEIAEYIVKISEKGIGVLISDHNVRDVLKICSTVFLIYDGKIRESGRPQDVINSKVAQDVFLGKDFSL